MIELEIFLYTCAVDGSECIWYFSFPFPLAKLGISTRLSKRNSPCVVVQSILWMRQIDRFPAVESEGRLRWEVWLIQVVMGLLLSLLQGRLKELLLRLRLLLYCSLSRHGCCWEAHLIYYTLLSS